MAINVNFTDRRAPSALVNEHGPGTFCPAFCTLILHTAEGSATFFLPAGHAAWARDVASAINTPSAAEVAA